jgi:hypothetical protein
MAYDLHVVRSREWTDASSAPITKPEVDAVVAADPELGWSSDDFVEMKDATGVSSRYYMIVWNGQPSFWWYRDQIIASGCDENALPKLIQLSRALGAQVIGDDGERYELRKSFLGKEKVAIVDSDA